MKSSEPSVTQLKTGKSWSQLTGNPHQRTSDIGIGTEPKWANIVRRGIQTVYGQVWLDVWPCEVQKVLHVVRHGTVVFLEDLRKPEPFRKTINIWRVRCGKHSLVVGRHGRWRVVRWRAELGQPSFIHRAGVHLPGALGADSLTMAESREVEQLRARCQTFEAAISSGVTALFQPHRSAQ